MKEQEVRVQEKAARKEQLEETLYLLNHQVAGPNDAESLQEAIEKLTQELKDL